MSSMTPAQEQAQLDSLRRKRDYYKQKLDAEEHLLSVARGTFESFAVKVYADPVNLDSGAMVDSDGSVDIDSNGSDIPTANQIAQMESFVSVLRSAYEAAAREYENAPRP